jgi:hypothetical protein
MLEVMPSYWRTINEGGRRRRDERFGRWGLNTDWRRRSSRKRRIILWNRRWGASERKGGSDECRGDDVRDGSKIGGGRRRNI